MANWRKQPARHLCFALAALSFCLINLSIVSMQSQNESGDTARGLWEKRFKTARAKKGLKRTSRPGAQQQTGLIGLTVWRLRSAVSDDDSKKPRLLVQKADGTTVQLLAERVGVDTLFNEGDMVRIGIEVPQVGYLYVINREVYDDGSLGVPYLIFPTRRIRGGNNLVTEGKVIEIPAQTDNPPYFTFHRDRKDQVSERLTVILSSQRLNLYTAADRTRLDPAQVERWERLWSGPSERRESASSAGKSWTLAEKEAAQGKRSLRQDDPVPQTIYQMSPRPGSPVLVVVPLRIAAK